MRGLRYPWRIIGVAALTSCTQLLGIDRDYNEVPDTGSSLEAGCSSGLGTDPKNCGRCGHDCQGGTCVSGQCQPVRLTIVSAPWGIAVDGTGVYITSHLDSPDGTVLKCPLSGCVNAEVLASGLGQPARIVVDSGTVYWSNYLDGTIDACPSTGCSDDGAQPTILASQQSGPIGLAVYDGNIYWANATNGSISMCPLSGCGSSPTTLAPTEASPIDVAADSTGVYWVSTGNGGALRFCALGGCNSSPTTLVPQEMDAYAVALHLGSATWADNVPTGRVRTCPESSCSPQTASTVAAADGATGLAVDDSGIYWVTSTMPGSVWTCALAGCPSSGPIELAMNQATPFAITLDTTTVYWTNSSDGTVMKVAKP